MKLVALLFAAAAVLAAQNPSPLPVSSQLLEVKRIYVSELTGGMAAQQLRDLIIAGLDSTRLFILTDNPDRADAVLKGAADDHAFVDVFDTSGGIGAHTSAGRSSGSASSLSRSGLALGASVNDNESHHIDERKHEAYASVRLCNKDGDVLWSTTQESLGAKFKGASADVASKIARQLSLDVAHARQGAQVQPGTPNPR
ncbi:MAG TPA: hypothetical protein VH351_13105 [Bryobacteraceae bacterium]|jgi:hypothetical protein|nr:hypothetical protein [Bryobacteraceae bacterium]